MTSCENGKCSEFSAITKRAAGWGFASLLYDHLGPGTIVLVGEGPNGADLEFSVSREWLKENNIRNFIAPRESMILGRHGKTCSLPQCVKASDRLEAIAQYLDCKASLRSCAMKTIAAIRREICEPLPVLRFEGAQGWAELVSELKPFIEWFALEDNFWINPYGPKAA